MCVCICIYMHAPDLGARDWSRFYIRLICGGIAWLRGASHMAY